MQMISQYDSPMYISHTEPGHSAGSNVFIFSVPRIDVSKTNLHDSLMPVWLYNLNSILNSI